MRIEPPPSLPCAAGARPAATAAAAPPLDPLQIGLDELDRRDLAAAHELRLLGRGREGEVGGYDALHSLRSSIETAITGPPGGRSRYCGYLAARSSTARGSSTIRAVPRKR